MAARWFQIKVRSDLTVLKLKLKLKSKIKIKLAKYSFKFKAEFDTKVASLNSKMVSNLSFQNT